MASGATVKRFIEQECARRDVPIRGPVTVQTRTNGFTGERVLFARLSVERLVPALTLIEDMAQAEFEPARVYVMPYVPCEEDTEVGLYAGDWRERAMR
jgi:hypothetical protein